MRNWPTRLVRGPSVWKSPADFLPALDQALAATKDGRPAVIECIVKAGYVWPGRGEPRA